MGSGYRVILCAGPSIPPRFRVSPRRTTASLSTNLDSCRPKPPTKRGLRVRFFCGPSCTARLPPEHTLRPSCDTRCWRAKLGMRHAVLLREAPAGITKPASAPCMILQCGTWYGCVAVWSCGCVFGGGMSDAIGSKNTCKTFSTGFLD